MNENLRFYILLGTLIVNNIKKLYVPYAAKHKPTSERRVVNA